MDDFKPPHHNSIVIAVAKALIPVASRKAQLDIELTRDFLANFRKYKNSSAMIMMNHADRFDPMVAFWLSKLCDEDFYYLAARELFDDPFNGWFMQRCGTYSVIRGHSVESVSAKKTTSIIAEGGKKLVMFPEGDVTGRDNEILPLKKDGIGNVLKAQKRVQEIEPDGTVIVLPISIFYKFLDDESALLPCLRNLEETLGIFAENKNFESRVESLTAALISKIAAEYEIDLLETDRLPARLLKVCRQMTFAVSKFSGAPLGEWDTENVLLYNVRAGVRERQHEMDKEKSKVCTKELDRIQQLLILASTLQQPFSLEVAWRVLDRIEQELTGKTTVKGRRRARLAMAAPIELREFDAAYNRDSEFAINLAERAVRTGMQLALQSARQSSTLISI